MTRRELAIGSGGTGIAARSNAQDSSDIRMNVQSLEFHSVTCWIELKRILGSGLEPDQRTWPQRWAIMRSQISASVDGGHRTHLLRELDRICDRFEAAWCAA